MSGIKYLPAVVRMPLGELEGSVVEMGEMPAGTAGGPHHLEEGELDHVGGERHLEEPLDHLPVDLAHPPGRHASACAGNQAETSGRLRPHGPPPWRAARCRGK